MTHRSTRAARGAGLGAWLAAASLLVACTQPPPEPVRVGTNIWIGYEPLYVGRDRGIVRDDEVRLVEYLSATQVLRSYRNGAVDAAALTLDEALLLAQQSPDVRIVLVLDESNGSDAVVGSSGVDGLAGLRGRRIGVEAGALGAYVLSRALERARLGPDDVTTVSLAAAEQERAYAAGAVDAVVTFQPALSRLLAAGAKPLFTSSEMPGEIVDVLVVRASFIAKNPAAVTALLEGWFRSRDQVVTHPADAARAMSRLGLSEAETLEALRGIDLPDLAENRTLLDGDDPALARSIRQLAAVMRANALLAPEGGPDLDALVDPAPLRATRP